MGDTISKVTSDVETTSSMPPSALKDAKGVDWVALRKELIRVMDRPDHDDGTLGPLFIRLAWHSSGTYCAKSKTGGSCGATMRFPKEANDVENKGLDKARVFLEPVKKKFPGISYSDLWVFAAYVFIEESGGPKLVDRFIPGRVDKGEDEAIAPGRLPEAEHGVEPEGMDEEGRTPGWEKNAQHIRDVFYRMGINDQEIVALLCGGHVYGRCHTENSGYAGAWVEAPWQFSNEYAADMVEDTWALVSNDSKIKGEPVMEEVRPSKGRRQYVGVPDDEEEEEVKAPEVEAFAPGLYKIVDKQYVNVRESPEVGSPILARPTTGLMFNILSIRLFGTAIRGRLETGGWASIIASNGAELFAREGDIQLSPGTYRLVKPGADVDTYAVPFVSGSEAKPMKFEKPDFEVQEVKFLEGRAYGLVKALGVYVLLFEPGMAKFWYERVRPGYNDKPRVTLNERPGAQMMLVSDMVLLWDENFKEHLVKYAEDEDLLREDFGNAFKKLTELGFREFPKPTTCPFAAA